MWSSVPTSPPPLDRRSGVTDSCPPSTKALTSRTVCRRAAATIRMPTRRPRPNARKNEADPKDKGGKEKPKKVVVEKNFDPKKLVSYVNNPKFSLAEQRRELDLLQKLEGMREAADRHRSAGGSGHQVDGNRLPHADRSARSVRRPQGIAGHARSVRSGPRGARLPHGGRASPKRASA